MEYFNQYFTSSKGDACQSASGRHATFPMTFMEGLGEGGTWWLVRGLTFLAVEAKVINKLQVNRRQWLPINYFLGGST